MLPEGAKLQEKVDIVLRLGEVPEINNVFVRDVFPSTDFVFESKDEVFFCSCFVSAGIDFLDKIFF